MRNTGIRNLVAPAKMGMASLVSAVFLSSNGSAVAQAGDFLHLELDNGELYFPHELPIHVEVSEDDPLLLDFQFKLWVADPS